MAFIGLAAVLEHLAGIQGLVQSRSSARAHFAAALDRWGRPDAVESLSWHGDPFGIRSATAHGRRTFGLEETSSRMISIAIDSGTGSWTLDGDDASFHLRAVSALNATAVAGLNEALMNS